MSDIGSTLDALADRSRRLLLQRLALGPATSGQLAELLIVSRPATSQHVRVLSQADLIRSTIIGRHRWHELSPPRLYELERWLVALLETYSGAPVLDIPGAGKASGRPPTTVRTVAIQEEQT